MTCVSHLGGVKRRGVRVCLGRSGQGDHQGHGGDVLLVKEVGLDKGVKGRTKSQ